MIYMYLWNRIKQIFYAFWCIACLSPQICNIYHIKWMWIKFDSFQKQTKFFIVGQITLCFFLYDIVNPPKRRLLPQILPRLWKIQFPEDLILKHGYPFDIIWLSYKYIVFYWHILLLTIVIWWYIFLSFVFFVCVVFRCTAYIETSDKFVLYAYCEN